MEHVAEITFRARQLGPLRPLSPEQIARLQDVGRGLGLPPKKILGSPCEHCNACSGSKSTSPGLPAPIQLGTGQGRDMGPDVDAMVRRVKDSVGRAITQR
jgi:hypothetical protein